MNCVLTFIFIIGFTIGFFLVFTTFPYIDDEIHIRSNIRKPFTHELLYKFWFNSNGFKSSPISADKVSFSSEKFQLESTFLYNKVKITCVIFVHNEINAFVIKVSWGKQCNTIHFYSRNNKAQIISVVKVRSLRRQSSWQQLCDIIRELWYKENIEWILFAPDNTFVIPENLRYFIAYRDIERPYYLGHPSHFWNQLYNSAETAYVLSRGALRLILKKFNSSSSCAKGGQYTNNEDYLLGKHLSDMGVLPEDTRDYKGRHRFHLFTPMQLIGPDDSKRILIYAKKSVYPILLGENCCSPSSISLKSSQDDTMFFIKYLMYNVKIFTSGNLGNNFSSIRTPPLEAAEKFIFDTLGKHINLSTISSEAYFKLWSLKIKSPEEFNEQIRKDTLIENNRFLQNVSLLYNYKNFTLN